MKLFLRVWAGQLVSTLGSYMTFFALSLWAWEVTESATALALVGFFSQLSRLPLMLIAGLIIDRFHRRKLMLLGDAIAALSTVIIGVLYLTDALQLWHLYGVAFLNGGFSEIQQLAYKASVSSLVPREQLTRVNSMNVGIHYGSIIISPALAGILYPAIGLLGILTIDLVTFAIGILTLLTCTIPNPSSPHPPQPQPIFAQLTFGFRQVWQNASWRSLLLITCLFWFFHDLGGGVYQPMILARTNGSATVLGSVSSAAGMGGVVGAVCLVIWGKAIQRRQGMLFGFIGAGISKFCFGLGQSALIWLPAQFCSSLNFPLLGSCETALWMTQITPETQGRIFAANALVLQGVRAIAALIAGPLADRVLEPIMQSESPLAEGLGRLFGNSFGSGMAFLYVSCALAMVAVGLGGFGWSCLSQLEGETKP